MKEMYETYNEVAEFRIVYIREAHAADSDWPLTFAQEKGITEHKDYGERCTTAEVMMAENDITIPCVIDNMDNAVNNAYLGHPTRVFLVRKDGILGVAAGRGPAGYKPGLQATMAWLAEYKTMGKEPDLPN